MPSKLSCVCDTNVLISGIILPGSSPVGELINNLVRHGDIIFSPDTFAEFRNVRSRPKFDRYVSNEARSTVLNLLEEIGIFVNPSEHFNLSRDPDDNKFIDITVDGRADCIISGDK